MDQSTLLLRTKETERIGVGLADTTIIISGTGTTALMPHTQAVGMTGTLPAQDNHAYLCTTVSTYTYTLCMT